MTDVIKDKRVMAELIMRGDKRHLHSLRLSFDTEVIDDD